MASRWLWGAVAVLAVVSASWLAGLGSLSQPSSDTGGMLPPVTATPWTPDAASSRTQADTTVPAHTQPTQTFRGARMDGRLWAGPDGHLIIDSALRQWFDSWLSLQGEWLLEDILAAMQQHFDALGEPATTEARELLQAYMDYRQALSDYDDRTGRGLVNADTDVLAQRLDWVERLRREFFTDAVVRAFFGADETLDRHLLARRQLRQQGASAEELQALEQTLPAEIQKYRQQSHSLRAMQEQEHSWQAEGMDAETLAQQKYEYRSRQWGEAAAQRLAKLDNQHQEWQQRIAQYAEYRQQLLNHGSGDHSSITAEQRTALNRWLQQHFSEQEQRRVPAALALYRSQQ